MHLNKIIIAGYELSGLGGMETVCSTLVSLLRRQHPGIDISFVFFKEGRSHVSDDWLGGNRHVRITSGIKHTKIRRLSFAHKLRKIISQEKPELIIALDTLSCFISNIARRYTRHKPVTFSWLHFSTHNLYKAEYVQRADYHLAISTEIKEQLIAMGIEGRRITTIYNPLPRHPFCIARPNGVPRFIYVGRVIADGQKNMRGLFEALSQVQGEWQLDIVGDGQDKSLLQTLAESLGISARIGWHGWQTRPWEYISTTLSGVTCLLSTSNYEGFGMSIAEASSYGVYAISSDCRTGPRDIIRENVNGNIYSLEKPGELVTLLQQVVDGKSLPANSTIQHAIEGFYEDNYIQHVVQAFEQAGLHLPVRQAG